MTTLFDTVAAPGPEPQLMAQEIVARYQKVIPGSAAEEELVCAYLPLVKTLVGRIAMTLPAHVEAEDLYSVGMVGLLNAVRNFDPKGGSSFESYARVRIRGAIFDELRRLDWVPRSVHEKARKVQAVIQELEQQKGALPAPEEIARALKLSLSEYEQLIDEIKPATFVCLDSVQSSDDGAEALRCESVADSTQTDPAEAAARNEMSELILQRLEQLPDMQKKVLALYYFEDLRLREIAEVFGVTESRICQIHAQAILNIKAFLRKQEEMAA
jgi:RNA polymerase sigma factor for flagellar operon FliA